MDKVQSCFSFLGPNGNRWALNWKDKNQRERLYDSYWMLNVLMPTSLAPLQVSDGLKDAGEPSSSGQHNTVDTVDSMLEGLTQDMKDLGVATVPKGNCAFCCKPIAGKVRGGDSVLVLSPTGVPTNSCQVVTDYDTCVQFGPGGSPFQQSVP